MLEKLSAVTVKGLDGEVVALGSLWQEHPVVLVWLRHFG